jgi:hypothetical protein
MNPVHKQALAEKRKRCNDDSRFGEELDDDVGAPSAWRQRTTPDVGLEIDETDHSHPSPPKSSLPLSREMQTWHQTLAALQPSDPFQWMPSDEARVYHAFEELTEVSREEEDDAEVSTTCGEELEDPVETDIDDIYVWKQRASSV